jgi:FKBP-type peptidyl-prolyl cis-trans isomerase
MARGIIFAVLAVAVIAGGVYFVRSQSATPAAQNQNNTNMDNELKIEDVKTGTGPAAKTGDRVTVHYTGTFADGRKFDSSLDRGEPFAFTIGAGGVIEGWEQGVVGMQAGGTRKLIIPPALGYGPNDYGPIPGGSTLYFTIELLQIGG